MHHRAGVGVVDIRRTAEGEGEAAAFQVVAERSEDAFDFSVIGVAGDAHLDGELADADEVFGRAVGLSYPASVRSGRWSTGDSGGNHHRRSPCGAWSGSCPSDRYGSRRSFLCHSYRG